MEYQSDMQITHTVNLDGIYGGSPKTDEQSGQT